jgi:hypothetical protein
VLVKGQYALTIAAAQPRHGFFAARQNCTKWHYRGCTVIGSALLVLLFFHPEQDAAVKHARHSPSTTPTITLNPDTHALSAVVQPEHDLEPTWHVPLSYEEMIDPARSKPLSFAVFSADVMRVDGLVVAPLSCYIWRHVHKLTPIVFMPKVGVELQAIQDMFAYWIRSAGGVPIVVGSLRGLL